MMVVMIVFGCGGLKPQRLVSLQLILNSNRRGALKDPYRDLDGDCTNHIFCCNLRWANASASISRPQINARSGHLHCYCALIPATIETALYLHTIHHYCHYQK